jgi:hypothetical protein
MVDSPRSSTAKTFGRIQVEPIDIVRRWVQSSQLLPRLGEPQPVSMEETMSPTASVITLLASVAFGLIVIAAVVRIGARTP